MNKILVFRILVIIGFTLGLVDFLFTRFLITTYPYFIKEGNPFHYPYFLGFVLLPLLFKKKSIAENKELLYLLIGLNSFIFIAIIINLNNYFMVLNYIN